MTDKYGEIEYNKPYDNVNHPKHYNRENGMEAIEEMIAVFGKEAVMHYCLCNIWKYRYRSADKNGQEDLEKSDWYMKKYMELKYPADKTCEPEPASTKPGEFAF